MTSAHHLGHALFASDIGRCAVAWSERGLTRVYLPEKSIAALRRRVADELGVPPREPPSAVRQAMVQIGNHLQFGQGKLANIAIDLRGVTPFRQRVYQTLRSVARGTTVSYKQLAARADSPRAFRAIGQAMANNPLPVVVPCHRVVSSNGAGGFTAYGGLATKETLLAREGVALHPQRGFEVNLATAVRALRQADPVLAGLIDRVGDFRMCVNGGRTTFVALARAIVYQQLTGRAAGTIYRRLVASVGGRFHAASVAAASDEQLRSAGLSASKCAAMRDLSQRALAGSIPSMRQLRRLDDEAIVAQLTPVRGIGRWSVEMMLMFNLGRPDVLPLGDYGVRKGYAITYDCPLPSPSELAAHGERWRPYRTMASWYLWRANDV